MELITSSGVLQRCPLFPIPFNFVINIFLKDLIVWLFRGWSSNRRFFCLLRWYCSIWWLCHHHTQTLVNSLELLFIILKNLMWLDVDMIKLSTADSEWGSHDIVCWLVLDIDTFEHPLSGLEVNQSVSHFTRNVGPGTYVNRFKLSYTISTEIKSSG